MTHTLDAWTFFLFVVPMPLLVIWALVTFFTERGNDT